MPTRNGGSALNQSLQSDLSRGKAEDSDKDYYAKNLKFFKEYGNEGADKVSVAAEIFAESTDVSPEMNGLNRASNSVEARALALGAKELMTDPNITMDTTKDAKAILDAVFKDKDLSDAARTLAQKVTEEAFKAFGRSDSYERNSFSIAEGKPNGIAVTPTQMSADVESLLANFAGGVALGITGKAGSGFGKQFVDSIETRIERNGREYGQYGTDKSQGGAVSMFQKAILAFNKQLEKKLPKAILNA